MPTPQGDGLVRPDEVPALLYIPPATKQSRRSGATMGGDTRSDRQGCKTRPLLPSGRLWPHRPRALSREVPHLNRLSSPPQASAWRMQQPDGMGRTGML